VLNDASVSMCCARDTVRKVRDGLSQSPDLPKAGCDPWWMRQPEWPEIIHDLGMGHPPKFIWEEKAQQLTTYSHFWNQFYTQYLPEREKMMQAGANYLDLFRSNLSGNAETDLQIRQVPHVRSDAVTWLGPNRALLRYTDVQGAGGSPR
jgi:hypothetical protein